MTGARIGERCNIGQNVLVSPEVTIGNNVKIQNNVSLYTGVIVEEDAFLGPSMVFTNVINPRSHVNRKNEYQTTLVKKGASIGAKRNDTVRDDAWTLLFCRRGSSGYSRCAGLRPGLWLAGAGTRVDVPVRRANKVHGTRRNREGGLSELRRCLSEARASCHTRRRRRMIPLVDLTAQYHSIKEEIDAAVSATLESGHFILGPAVSTFEQSVASYLGVEQAIGLASGTDALVLALRALNIGPGDEVIVPAYTFFATAGTVMSVGAKPVFVDIDPASYEIDVTQIKDRITPRTKAIIPVHLYGHPAEMDPILEIAKGHNLKVIEDNAQGFGAEYKGKKTGSLGDIACLSFFPTKNLGAYGDGGMVVTNDPALAERMRRLRTHGWKKKYYSEEVGYNSRLDALQAAILQAKLPHVDAWNDKAARAGRQVYRAPGSVEDRLCRWSAPGESTCITYTSSGRRDGMTCRRS